MSVQTATKQSWLPVVALSFASFIFVTTELMPIGLLPKMAKSMDQLESTMGLVLTLYAWGVALVSLPLTLLLQKVDRRKLMVGIFSVFIGGHILAALSPNFWLLLAGRLTIAMAHAVFWSITMPLATRLAPSGYATKGMALVIAGVSLASVLGIPIGTLLGNAVGWRLTFACLGGAGFLVIIILIRSLPALPSRNINSSGSLPVIFQKVEQGR